MQTQDLQEIAANCQNATQDAPSLYDRDFMLWIETTAQLLKEQKFTELDLENLIEEIESMGRSNKSALRSNLVVVLLHLLKWKYQSEKRTNSWKASIFEHRLRLDEDFIDSPSLKRYFAEIFDKCYQNARKLAAIETGLELEIFPVESPFTPEQVLDPEFLP
jgi:type I site-specific restriction-modification system R (restriction) subunit